MPVGTAVAVGGAGTAVAVGGTGTAVAVGGVTPASPRESRCDTTRTRAAGTVEIACAVPEMASTVVEITRSLNCLRRPTGTPTATPCATGGEVVVLAASPLTTSTPCTTG